MEEVQHDKREHLIEVAEKLFGEHGFDGTSIRMLAKEADVNIAMISYYFGSKEKMLEAILEQKAKRNQANFAKIHELPNATPWEKMEAVIDLYVEMMSKNKSFHKVMFREVALVQREGMKDKIANLVAGNIKNIRAIVQEGVDKGIFKDIDAPMLMSTLVGTISQTINYSRLSEQIICTHDKIENISEADILNRLRSHLKEMFKFILIQK